MVNPWWVTGIIDGEGCFRAYPRLYFTTSKKNRARGVNLALTISMRADDIDTLVKIQNYFGCGKFYSHHSKKGKSNWAMKLELSTKGCWLKIIDHFNQYPLQSKKQNDFLLWKQIANIAIESNWSQNRKKMIGLCKELQTVKLYNSVASHNKFRYMLEVPVNPTLPKGENVLGAVNQQATCENRESSTTTRETGSITDDIV